MKEIKKTTTSEKQDKPPIKKVPPDKDALTEEETKRNEEEEKRRRSQTPTGNQRNSQGGIWQGPDTVPDENTQQSVEGNNSPDRAL